jgi:hypothetical protein
VDGADAPASSIVTVGFRHVGATAWTDHTVRADTEGDFALSFPLTADTQVRALAGTISSAIHTVAIVRASCATSGPAFTSFPIAAGDTSGEYADFVAFNATRDGLWAGVATNTRAGEFGVITWRAGQQPRVLDRFQYIGVQYETDDPGSVEVLGVGPQGQVLVAAEGTTKQYDGYHGYLYGGVHRTTLAASPSWTSVQPTGMSSAGVSVGQVTYLVGMTRHYAAVAWTAGGTHVHVLHDNANDPAIDLAGDIAYFTGEGYGVLVTTNGASSVVPSPYNPDGAGNYATVGGSAHALYGWDGEPVRWDIGTSSAGSPVPVSPPNEQIYAAGPNGELVLGDNSPQTTHQLFVTATGALVPLTNELYEQFSVAGIAIDASGTIAYTESDNQVHLMTCH